MPAYLIHGFQWPRKDIRIWVIENNLEEVAPEWLIGTSINTPSSYLHALHRASISNYSHSRRKGPESARGIHENFENLFPAELADLPNFRFIEQYNPTEHPDLKSQDYAYVCTAAIQITLNCPVDQVMAKGIPSQMYAAMSKIRDHLAVAARMEPSGWRIGWWVVYCEDEERDYAPLTSRSVADSTGEGVSLGGMVEGRTSVNNGVSLPFRCVLLSLRCESLGRH